MGKLITTDEAAKILEISPVRVRQLIAAGALKSEKRGRDHLLDEDDVMHFNEHERRNTGRPPRNDLRTR